MEALARAKTIVFDKTGTLTRGVFEVEAIHPNQFSEQELLHLAAHVEQFSTHQSAIALRNAYKDTGVRMQSRKHKRICRTRNFCRNKR